MVYSGSCSLSTDYDSVIYHNRSIEKSYENLVKFKYLGNTKPINKRNGKMRYWSETKRVRLVYVWSLSAV